MLLRRRLQFKLYAVFQLQMSAPVLRCRSIRMIRGDSQKFQVAGWNNRLGREIDALVYYVYALSPTEIKTLERWV